MFQRFMYKPRIDMYPGIKITKESEINYKNENVEQTLKNLNFHSVQRKKGENFESSVEATIKLSEGDVLIFEGEERGYVAPVEKFVTVKEAIQELNNIKDLV